MTAYDLRISDLSSDVCSSDLLILDVSMKSGGGLAILSAIRGSGSTVPVIFMTVHIRPEQTLEAIKLGVDGEIGRATCRERVCKYVEISVVAVSLKKKTNRATRERCTQK